MKPEPFQYFGIVGRVIDGDTIVISEIDLGFSVKLANEKLRFHGINTPESRTRNLREKEVGLRAKARVEELLPVGEPFTFKSLGFGKYGRILGIPFTACGKDVCSVLVQEGLARVYSGGKREPWFSDGV
tara:strand:- start:91 stop:477 length:387 start_codon:yes stop_codon:yes gene_type:complete